MPKYFIAVFLDDVLLDLLVDDLDDDWYKIFVLAGLPFVEIEEAISQSKNVLLVKKQVCSLKRLKKVCFLIIKVWTCAINMTG